MKREIIVIPAPYLVMGWPPRARNPRVGLGIAMTPVSVAVLDQEDHVPEVIKVYGRNPVDRVIKYFAPPEQLVQENGLPKGTLLRTGLAIRSGGEQPWEHFKNEMARYQDNGAGLPPETKYTTHAFSLLASIRAFMGIRTDKNDSYFSMASDIDGLYFNPEEEIRTRIDPSSSDAVTEAFGDRAQRLSFMIKNLPHSAEEASARIYRNTKFLAVVNGDMQFATTAPGPVIQVNDDRNIAVIWDEGRPLALNETAGKYFGLYVNVTQHVEMSLAGLSKKAYTFSHFAPHEVPDAIEFLESYMKQGGTNYSIGSQLPMMRLQEGYEPKMFEGLKAERFLTKRPNLETRQSLMSAAITPLLRLYRGDPMFEPSMYNYDQEEEFRFLPRAEPVLRTAAERIVAILGPEPDIRRLDLKSPEAFEIQEALREVIAAQIMQGIEQVDYRNFCTRSYVMGTLYPAVSALRAVQGLGHEIPMPGVIKPYRPPSDAAPNLTTEPEKGLASSILMSP